MIRKLLLVAFILFSPFLAPALAEENNPLTEFSRDGNVVKGKLSAYGKSFVVVGDEKIRLCKDASILDAEGNPITVSGLCATEAVAVTLDNHCAREVQVTLIRR